MAPRRQCPSGTTGLIHRQTHRVCSTRHNFMPIGVSTLRGTSRHGFTLMTKMLYAIGTSLQKQS